MSNENLVNHASWEIQMSVAPTLPIHENQWSVEDILGISQFVIVSNEPNKVMINTNWISLEEIRKFFDRLFTAGSYIEWLWDYYDNLMWIMYNNLQWEIQIWTTIKPIEPERKKMYEKVTVSEVLVRKYVWGKAEDVNKVTAEFIFSKIVIDEIYVPYSIDEFIAMMWGVHNIRFWLNISAIRHAIYKVFEDPNPTAAENIVFAEWKEATNWKDAYLVSLENLLKDPRIKEDIYWKWELNVAVRAIEEIKKWMKLFSVINAEYWVDGFDIYWDKILPKAWKRIDLDRCIDKTCISISYDGKVTFLVAEKDGFIHPSIIRNNDLGIWIISADDIEHEVLTINEDIQISSVYPSSIIWAPWKVIIKWTSWDKVDQTLLAIWKWYILSNANSIVSNWLIEWYMHAFWDIDITWNIIWPNIAKNNSDWVVKSDNWNVIINWRIVRWYISALNGIVEANWIIENSLVVWKKVVSKWAQNTTFICEEFEGEWTYNNCCFIVSSTMHAENFNSLGWNNKVIIVPPINYDNEENELNDKIELVNNKLDYKKFLLIFVKKKNNVEISNEDEKFYSEKFWKFRKDVSDLLRESNASAKIKKILTSKAEEEILESLLKQEKALQLKISQLKMPEVKVSSLNWSLKVFEMAKNFEFARLTNDAVFALYWFKDKINESLSVTILSWPESEYVYKPKK